MAKVKSSNAASGLNLMFVGQLLAILGVVFALITAILVGGKAVDDLSEGVVAIIGITGFLVGVAAIVGFILMLVGLGKAGKDQGGFKLAFWLTIGSLIAQVVATIITLFAPLITTIITIAVAVIEIIVTYLVITTASNLLETKGKKDVAAFGRTVWLIYAICLIASIVLSIVSAFVPLPAGAIAMIISLALNILEIVGYVMFVIFLRRASVNLA